MAPVLSMGHKPSPPLETTRPETEGPDCCPTAPLHAFQPVTPACCWWLHRTACFGRKEHVKEASSSHGPGWFASSHPRAPVEVMVGAPRSLSSPPLGTGTPIARSMTPGVGSASFFARLGGPPMTVTRGQQVAGPRLRFRSDPSRVVVFEP